MSNLNLGRDLYLKGRIGWRGLSKDEYLSVSDYRIINATALMDGFVDWDNCGYISKERYDESPEIMLQEGDLLISKDGTLGKIGYVKGITKPCTVASGIFVLRNTIPDVLNFDYLYHVLKSHIFKGFIARNQALGSTISHLYQSDLENFEMELPSLDDQELIASVLNTIDAKIANNNAICSNLEAMAKLLYDYWFVQFDFPDENGNPYKSSGGKMVWNDELKREIPAGWEVKPLDNIITESSKSTVQVNGAKVDGIYPFFTSGSAILAYDQYFVDGFHCFLNTGGNPDIKGYKGKCAYSTDTWCIDAGKYSYFMYQYFMLIMPQFEQLFFAGSGLKHLQKDALKKQCVVLPSDEVIGEFNDVLDDLWDKRTECFLENQQLASFRDFLLPMLMNGQVKVGA